MNDQELREMIRDSIARQAGAPRVALDPAAAFNQHVSHLRLPIHRGSDDDGQCIIEPSVRCNHCGYCQSLGH